MKKIIILSALLVATTALSHDPKHITSTNSTSKAIKRHKAQQLKSEKKVLKTLKKNLELLKNQKNAFLNHVYFIIKWKEEFSDYDNHLSPKLCANAENIKKIENQISTIKTKTTSAWVMLAQHQSNIKKTLKR